MPAVQFIGFAAAFCTTVAFLPQVLKVWRTRSAADLSLPMFVLLLTGIVLWLAYGIVLRDAPIIAANLVSLLLNLSIVGLALRYRRRPNCDSHTLPT